MLPYADGGQVGAEGSRLLPWFPLGEDLDPDGITIFRNAVKYVRENLRQSCTA